MHKVKVKLSFECEMELNPEWYDEGATVDQMIEIEKSNAKDDPYLYMDVIRENQGSIDIEIEEIK